MQKQWGGWHGRASYRERGQGPKRKSDKSDAAKEAATAALVEEIQQGLHSKSADTERRNETAKRAKDSKDGESIVSK